ncbi:hypothetical protein AB0J52_22010 [Spirillospora sp. NPDC049652]
MIPVPLTAAEPLATHSAVTAIPFFVPTFVVVAVIAVIIWRDRRTPDDPDTDGTGTEEMGAGDDAGTGGGGRERAGSRDPNALP